jgi:hypothetical protein
MLTGPKNPFVPISVSVHGWALLLRIPTHFGWIANQNRRSAFSINLIRLIDELFARYSPATMGYKAVSRHVICGGPATDCSNALKLWRPRSDVRFSNRLLKSKLSALHPFAVASNIKRETTAFSKLFGTPNVRHKAQRSRCKPDSR